MYPTFQFLGIGHSPLPWHPLTAKFKNRSEEKMVESVSFAINDDSKLKETLVGEDSVPTDLTVSVSAPSQDQEISELSLDGDKRSQQDQFHHEIVKRLRSEVQLHKLLVAQKNAETERLLADKKQEIELLKQHVHLSNRENEALKKENTTLSEDIVDLQTKHLRYVSGCM